MELHLQNTLALVSGSTMGIGKAVAKGLLQEGARVIVNGRSDEHVEKAVRELSEIGTVYGIAADLATREGADHLIAAANNIGPPDILVNNVGFFEQTPFFEIGDDEWIYHFELNVMSGVRLSRAFMRGMLDRNWGRIIFIASEAGVKPIPELIHYSVTKTSQISLARGLAELTKGTGVTVNSVLPGPTMSEGSQIYFEKIAATRNSNSEAMRKVYFENDGFCSLLQRFAAPQEVADLVVFLCSKNAAVVNGSAQRVEGGLIRAIL